MSQTLLARHVAGPLSTLCKRAGPRIKNRATNLVSAAEACGPLEHGAIVTGVTKGSFSMLDLIEHVLNFTGPASVDISTWTMGVYDADVLWKFAESGAIQRIRFLLDPSMFRTRDNRYAPAFLAAFGGDSLRAVENHAKFTTIGNEHWRITICSSMNLNRNTRLENFVIFEDADVHAFYSAIVDQAFAQLAPLDQAKKVTRACFEGLDLELGNDRGPDRQDPDHGGDPRHQRGASRSSREVW